MLRFLISPGGQEVEFQLNVMKIIFLIMVRIT